MNEVIEALLVAWGNEVISPALDVSIRSPLGTMGEEGGRSVGGSRCLSSVECEVVVSRASAAVGRGIALLAKNEVDGGLGSKGRSLQFLALVRYTSRPKLAVAAQCHTLGISVRTYRTRVGELHQELAKVLPGVAAERDVAERGTDAAAAARSRARAVRLAGKDEAKRLELLKATGRANRDAYRVGVKVGGL
ncbi:hypothetical protein [Pseudomonas sp. PA27(2017)]|uniref:hypothetical protein n=1 Tax=Pseudomonas sp. PA27(2017) TaxID=1932112 RepID=UPI0009642488|nr:hypothetical protein [Pseudomonas sp. PA27(2017)]OLU23860.1 hypothetical protein BVH06_22040 [Pseudomonas sp. PA27(2017)]